MSCMHHRTLCTVDSITRLGICCTLYVWTWPWKACKIIPRRGKSMLRCCMGYGSSVPPGTMPMLLITERFAMPLSGTERYCVCGNTTNQLCHVKVLQWSFFYFHCSLPGGFAAHSSGYIPGFHFIRSTCHKLEQPWPMN